MCVKRSSSVPSNIQKESEAGTAMGGGHLRRGFRPASSDTKIFTAGKVQILQKLSPSR